jgi:hypothetical protein
MIILRQKEYSSRKKKALLGVKTMLNNVKTLPARLRRGYYEATGDLGQRAIADMTVKEKTKSKRQLKKETINLANKVEKVVDTAKHQNPSKIAGEVVEKGVETVATHPVGSVVWAGTSFLPVPSTPIAIAADKATGRVFKGYGKGYSKRKRHPVKEFLGGAARVGTDIGMRIIPPAG